MTDHRSRQIARQKDLCAVLALLLLFAVHPPAATAAGVDPAIIIPPSLTITLPTPLTGESTMVLPFFISNSLFPSLMMAGKNAPDSFFRGHLYDTTNAYSSQTLLDLQQNSEHTTARDFFAELTLPSDLDPEDYHLMGLRLPVSALAVSHKNLSTINLTTRLYSPNRTYQKDYFSMQLNWIPATTTSLILTPEIEQYIQVGGLTCEFASAQNALAMLGITTDEVQDLIPRFPHGDVHDPAKNPTDYFLGEYGFGKQLPQAIDIAEGPLGGYGLHLGEPYLEKVIKPYAPGSTLHPFSFATIDAALAEQHPVIVQGLQISYDNQVVGGQSIRLNEDDHRGLVTGEHTYVLFAKNEDGTYRMKDPYKRSFRDVPATAVEKSIARFQAFGAQANIVVVRAAAEKKSTRNLPYIQNPSSGEITFSPGL